MGESDGAALAKPKHLLAGVFVGAHGIQGEVKLLPVTDFPERLRRRKSLLIRYPDGREETRKVRSNRVHKTLILVRLEGVSHRDQAEALRGAQVLIPLEEAATLPEGQYYEHQLLGLRVLTPEGEELGRIERILECGSNDVYVAGKWMIPATHDAVLKLAPDEGVLIVRSREYLEGEEAL